MPIASVAFPAEYGLPIRRRVACPATKLQAKRVVRMSERTRLIIARWAVAVFAGGLLGSVLVFFFVGVLIPVLLYGLGGSGPSTWEDLAYVLALAFLFLCEAVALGLVEVSVIR